MNWIKQIITSAKSKAEEDNMQRQFAWLMIAFCGIYVVYRFYIGFQMDLRLWVVLILAICFMMLLVSNKTGILRHVLLVWFTIGFFLGEISSTIILGFIYWIIFTPIVVFLNLLSKKETTTSEGWSDYESSENYEQMY